MSTTRPLLLVSLAWTVLLGASLGWNLWDREQRALERAHGDAASSLDKDMVIRRWGTRHGGVYVPVRPDQQPVPWLSHIPDRDLTTRDGRKFTLINPATMVRQIMDDYGQLSGIAGRITGLKYLNPDNAPDTWERRQLERFAAGGEKEVWEIADFQGQPHLRHLRAMYMEPGCDKCHAILGFKTGDFRGATGVNLPLTPYYNQLRKEASLLSITHGLIWIAGLIGIGATTREIERRQAEVKSSEKRFRDLFENSPDPCWLIRNKVFIDCNRAAVNTLGYKKREDILLHPSKLSPEDQPDGRLSFEKSEEMMDLAEAKGIHRFEWEHRRADNSSFPVEVTLARLSLDDGPVLYCIWRDISARKAAEVALRAERDRSKLYLDTVQSIIVALDVRGCVTMINQFGADLLGHPIEALIGRNWFDTILPPDCREVVGNYFAKLLRGEISNAEYFENELQTVTGRPVLVAWHNALLKDPAGRIVGTLSAGEDITERRAAEEEIHSLAFYDPLTGLPNRRLLLDRLQLSMAASARTDKHRALFYLDLDRFKVLNDTLGHDVGDRLLVEMARRLRHCVREVDTVSRLGGDEFVVLLEQLSVDREDATRQAMIVGEKIVDALSESCDLGIDTYRGTASIGVALFVGQEASVEELLKRADLAMYQAKAAGRNTLRFFDPQMQETLTAHTAMEKEIRLAIVDSQFLLHYQPQVLANGDCVGVEALIRWQHPLRGIVPPNEFIPVAEDTGLIVPIGRWVLHEACARLREWKSDPDLSDIAIAVNVSARQFREDNFLSEIQELVRHSEIEPRLLKLEITESMLVADVDEVIRKMKTLREIGIPFALDDFGTGYSSLSYVKKLPLDQLKIDRSFVRDVLIDPNDAAICRAIIALGETLGLQTVAEGVETDEQWDFLTAAGCRMAQGYRFARPMDEAALREWLTNRVVA